MSRAVVLGGGGPVGIAWEAGLVVGLVAAGVDLGTADAVVGTSAGSVVGMRLAGGHDLADATSLLGGPAAEAVAGKPGEADAALEQLMMTVAGAAGDPGGAEAVRARLGAFATSATTIPESSWLAAFEVFVGAPWPSGYACTAVDCATGAFRVWDAAAGIDPHLAIASSCAVPGIFPPVTIGGARYMDGGVRDMLNADVAAGHDAVVAVSCTLLELPPGFEIPGMDAVLGATRARIDEVARGGAEVATVVPGAQMLEVSGWGMHLMDFSRVDAAFEAGVAQGGEEAARVGATWG